MAANPRTRSPRGQGSELRERLLEVATELVDELGGTASLSIRGVTKRAGVSPMAFYLHFADRDELVDEVVERGFARFVEFLYAARDRHEDPRERLLAMGVAYMAFAREQPALYTVIFGRFRGPHDPPPSADEVPVKHRAASAQLAFEALVEAVTACGPDGADARTTALGLWSGLHGFVTLAATRPAMEWPEDEAFTRLLMDRWL